jgi:glycosyltransferase involved in cell wall biosynthesis
MSTQTLARRLQSAPSERDGGTAGRERPPRVSVGMPAYNAARYIEAAIESVLQQTFTDLELIVQDNASTDETVAICQAIAKRDPRLRVICNPVNLGVNPNYRIVAQNARGEYFKWHSANDLIDRDFIGRCVELLDARRDAVLAFGRTILFEGDPEAGSPYDDNCNIEDDDPVARFRRTVVELRLNNPINGLIRRDVLMRTSIHADYYSSDNVVLSELALAGKLVLLPETRFYRRMDPHSATRMQSASAVRRAHYPTNRFGSFFQSWQLQSGYFRAVTRSHLAPGRRFAAWRYVMRQAYWARPRLGADLLEALRFYVLRERQ